MINLLPPKEKELLVQEEQFKIALILEILVLAFLVFLALALFLVNAHILRKIALEQAQTTLGDSELKTSDIKALKERVSFYNQELSKLDAFFGEQILLSEAIEKIEKTLPSGVYLTSLSYQKETKKIGIGGFCPTREILFELKKNLQESEMVKGLDFPASNWARAKDIEFHLNFQIR